MSEGIPPPTDVLVLVFLAWMAGTAVVGAASRMWGEIQPGHFKVVWLTCTGFGLAAGFGYRPAWIAAALTLGTFASIYAKRDREAGIAAAGVSLAVLAYGAPIYALAVAALLGTVTNAMLLGHWHLNQPKLGIGPIKRTVWLVWIALATFAATTSLGVSGENIAVVGSVTALAFTAFSAVLTAMVGHLVRTRSIMSATGILYLVILLCVVAAFTGSLAALAGA